jgi:hypothetical protein
MTNRQLILNPSGRGWESGRMFTDDSSHTAISRERPNVPMSVPRSVQRAICQLVQASKYAEDTGRSAWEFAITIGEFRGEGASENDLRWLICRGYIEHAEEVTPNGSERAFDRQPSLRFSERSAFVVTSAGAAFSRQILGGTARNEDRGFDGNSIAAAAQPARLQKGGIAAHETNGAAHPKWDRDRRELRLGDKLVKVFKLPSPMQEAILMAFEEERWPPRIDDPLPAHPELLPKRRLHDTIKSLNRNQKNCLIRFMGDGTGEGIRWEPASLSDSEENSNLLLQ